MLTTANERPDWPGSKWLKFDLHAHTPASYDHDDYKAYRERPEDFDFERWITAARDAGLDAVAATDHNSAEAIDAVKEAAARVENAPVVFPGVELTASDGSHLLLIMDPSAGRDHVQDLLSRADIPVSERGTAEGQSSMDVRRILDEFGDEAVIVAAHANVGKVGILAKLGGRQRLNVLRHSNLAAVEIDPDRDLGDLSWLDGSKSEVGRRIPQIYSSDSHRFSEAGRRFTWIKMTEPNLEGLRLALMDGESSLKPARAGDSENPNARASTSIEKIVVHNAKFIGRPKTVVKFNPWLNAIIGGRGTGKSTLVDFCRKTLRRDGELDSVDRQEEGPLRGMFDRRMTPSFGDGDGLLTNNANLEVFYLKDGQRFRLAWNPSGSAAPVVRLDADGEIPEEGDIRERFPVRIYSQKQLFALARNPSALLDVIDAAQETRANETKRRVSQLKSAYLSLRAEARSALALARDLPNRRAALDDVRRKLDVFEQGGHSRILGVYRFRRQLNDAWDAVLESAEKSLDSAREAVNDLAPADLDFGANDQDAAPNDALARAHQSLASVMDGLRRNLTESVSEAARRIEGIRAGADAAEWRAAVEASQTEYEAASSQLLDAGISDPAEYGALLDSAAILSAEIQRLTGQRDTAEDLERQAADTLAEYRRELRELSRKRKQFASEVSRGSDTLRLQVRELSDHGDQDELPERIGEFLGTSAFQSDREAVADMIRPPNGGEWTWSRLDDVAAKIRLLQSGEIESWGGRDRRFESALKRAAPEMIDRLTLYAPKDGVQVEFRDNKRSGWSSLSQGSPGQQTAALLAFVLSFGNEPIILDQPEDDLDNTVIYELLVNRLKEKKRERQVIVVTHNPNIVVHGDAEFVVSLDFRNGRTIVNRRGGLQELAVRDEICRVMEGGRDAFRDRYRRIVPQRGMEP